MNSLVIISFIIVFLGFIPTNALGLSKALLQSTMIGAASTQNKSSTVGKPQKNKLVFDLQQLINMAISNSPEVREAQSEVKISMCELAQAKAAYYPQIELKAITGPVNDAKEPIIVNNKIYDPSPGTSFSSIGIFGRLDFTITQPLFTFGRLSYHREAARWGVDAKKTLVEQIKGDIALRVKKLYYGLVQAHRGIKVADQADEYFMEVRHRIKRLLELGATNVSESDLYRLDAFRAEAKKSKAEAEKGAQVAYFALKSMIGLDPSQEFEPADRSLSIESSPLPPLSFYLDKALSDRPEYKQLLRALKAREFQVKAAHSERLPVFFMAMEGSVARAPGRDTLDNPYIDDEFNHTYVGVVAGMKWDLDFGISKAREAETRAELQKLLNAKAIAEMSIPIEITHIYRKIQKWKISSGAYRQAADAARKWVITAIAEFDMGVGTVANMIDAIEKYAQNEGNYLDSVYNYLVTMAELTHATGIKDW